MTLPFEGEFGRSGEPRPLPVSPEPSKAPRVLLVEDDALLGIVLAETLDDMGYEVCAITTGETDAVAAAARHHPDLMIVDVNLAEGGGVAAVQRILASGFIPHVFMSGDTSRLLLMKPNAIILRKPFKDADLGCAIHRALRITSA